MMPPANGSRQADTAPKGTNQLCNLALCLDSGLLGLRRIEHLESASTSSDEKF